MTNGEISLEIVRADGYEPSNQSTKNVTVLDKAKLPLITITAENAGPIDEGETAVFTLSATPNPTAEIMVSVDVDHVQGTTGNFILPADKKVHEVPVSTAGSGRFEVRTVSDTILEDSGAIQATLEDDPLGEEEPSDVDRTSSTTYLIGSAPVPARVSITDNDRTGVPSVTISGSDSIDEGDTATFTLTANPIETSPVEVSVRISHQGNFFSRDLSTTNTFTFVIPHDGETPGELVIAEATVTDAVDEDDGSITLRVLSDPKASDLYAVGTNSSATTTVVDNDDSNLPNVTISGSSPVNESGDAVFTISATTGSEPSINVRVQVTETGNFLTNTANIRTIPVAVGFDTPLTETLVEDDYDEEDGSITATILKDDAATPTYGIGANTTATIQVSDNDAPPNMTISVEPVTEGDDPNSNANMIFTVEIDEQSQKEISVNYATTANGTATSDTDFSINPGDFLATSGTLNFTKRVISDAGVVTAGVTSQTFSVPIYGDLLDEDDETVIVSLTSPQNATLAAGEQPPKLAELLIMMTYQRSVYQMEKDLKGLLQMVPFHLT